MKKPFLLLFFLGGLLCAASCEKQKDYGPQTTTGMVIDKTTGEAVPYASVYLISKERGQDNSEEILDAMLSEQDGSFQFEFIIHRDSVYKALAIKDRYLHNGNNETWIKDMNQHVKVPLQPIAHLKLRIKNIPPASSSDKISVSAFNYSIGPFPGATVDTVLVGQRNGNSTAIVYFWITEAGNRKEFADTIFCAAHDTTYHEILY